MCIIAIKPKNKEMFSDELLKTMFENNPDGAGYMYYDLKKKKVVIKKGFMTLKALKSSLKKQDFKKTNLVMHFRIGTSGLNDKFNCHPYPVFEKNSLETDTQLGVAHNGVFHSYTPNRTSKINDTQVFISKVLRNLRKDFLYDLDKVALLQELIGTNKLAFLDNNNKVHTLGNFISDKGYLFSNTSYEERRIKYSNYTTYTPTYNTPTYLDSYLKSDNDDEWGIYDLEYWRDVLGSETHKKATQLFGEDYYETNSFWDWIDEEGIFDTRK